MRFLFGILVFGTVCLCLAVLLGFLGRLHPVFDTLSLLRPLFAGLCLLVLVFPMGLRLRMLVAFSFLMGTASTLPLFFGGTDGDDMRIYTKNLLYRNPQLPAVAADIRASDADVITLQEVSGRNERLLDALSKDYPYQHLCRFSGWSGIAVLSRSAMQDKVCSARRGLAAARISHEGQGVWIASVHLTWPFPYGNSNAAKAAVDVLDDLDGPVVMAGDFNIFPWAASVGRMKRTAEVQLVRPLRPTFDLQGVPLLLDHIYAPEGGTASYRPFIGSDHLGVVADVGLGR